ncbi:MAG: hypothetical protein ACRDQT_01465 [Gaiellaceae bacterium]
MKRRISTIVAGLATLVALVAVPSAYAAYTTAKLEVVRTGTGVRVSASSGVNDDATARAQIFAPVGTSLTTNQAPGTALGAVEAQVSALALGGALLPLLGQVVVAAPGQVPAATQAQCTLGVTPIATWVLVLQAAGQTINLPAFLLPVAANESALGAAKIVVCLAPPGVPADQGGAVFGAKFLSAAFTVNGVFGGAAAGVWLSIWTPWTGNAPPLNAAGTVASPAAVAAGTVTVAARRRGAGANVTGRVLQGGQPRAGATVNVFAGPRANRLRRVGRVRTNARGAYALRTRSGVFFRATATAPAGAAPAACAGIASGIAPIPCVNPTTSGFTARSRAVRKR